MIKGKVTYKPAIKYLRKIEKQSRFAHAVALTETAPEVKEAEVTALVKYLDRPTTFTKNAYGVSRATPKKPVATVYAKTIQDRYLTYAVYGGTRFPKGQAIPIPVGQKRNKFGSMSRTAIGTLFKNPKVFSGIPHGRKTPGIYKRMGRGGRKNLRLMVKYQRAARYSKRLPFFSIARTVVNRRFKHNFHKAFRAAMRTAR